jgi:hypothetical protein
MWKTGIICPSIRPGAQQVAFRSRRSRPFAALA